MFEEQGVSGPAEISSMRGVWGVMLRQAVPSCRYGAGRDRGNSSHKSHKDSRQRRSYWFRARPFDELGNEGRILFNSRRTPRDFLHATNS